MPGWWPRSNSHAARKAAWSISYRTGASMGLHQDRDERGTSGVAC